MWLAHSIRGTSRLVEYILSAFNKMVTFIVFISYYGAALLSLEVKYR